MLGAAALPFMLLCVGAALQFHEVDACRRELLLAACAKFAVFPALVWLIAISLTLTDAEGLVLPVFSAVPTAIAGQTQARAVGRNVALMSATITVQTVASIVILQLMLMAAWT